MLVRMISADVDLARVYSLIFLLAIEAVVRIIAIISSFIG